MGKKRDRLVPTCGGHLTDFLEAVEHHPDAKEVGMRLVGLQAEVAARGIDGDAGVVQ